MFAALPCRRLFPYSKWGAEVNARITPAFFTWLVSCRRAVPTALRSAAATIVMRTKTNSLSNLPLGLRLAQVGPMQTVAAEVDGQQQMSAVKIERCRYLAESG